MKRIREPAPNKGGRIEVPSGAGGSTQNSYVRFSFLHFDSSCMHLCSGDQMQAFTERLKRLSALTWQQVTQSPRHAVGSEKIPRTQLKVPCTLSPDVEHVLSFRYHGFMPMLGHREHDTLHVLWVDHNHTAY